MKRILLASILFPFFLSVKAQGTKQLWGVTEKGGESYGVIFKTDQNGQNQQIIHAFKASTGGKSPSYGKLCEGATGKLYGVLDGGKYDNGILIEFKTDTNALVKKVDFKESINGAGPFGLVKAANGKLYGVTHNDGTTQKGTIFEYDASTNVLTTKVIFTGPNGANPYAVLLLAANGKLYGTTEMGGANELGVLFEYDPATNTFTKKIDFDDVNGASPRGELIAVTLDKLIGTTYMGGTDAMGTVFEYTISTNTLVKKLDFKGTNGSYPIGGLRLANNSLYGNTLTGGATDEGILFKLSTTTFAFTKIIDFSGTTSGSFPHASLAKATNGLLYGTATEGGANSGGTVFQVDPQTDIFTKLWDFSNVTSGRFPFATLMQANNGKLYGTTSQGGTSDRGTVFEYNITTKTLTKQVDFENGIEGEAPRGNLMRATNAKIYGGTAFGGTYGFGTLFECDPNVAGGAFKKKIDFDGINTGDRPVYAPVEVNGKLYGTTEMGGANDKGVLYAYDLINGSFIKKIDFDGTEKGQQPMGLLKAPNNKLYGMTTLGGKNGKGVIYEFDPALDSFAKKVDFNASENGASPYGNLILASNGKIYGLTSYADAAHKGTLFEYDYVNNMITKRVDFGGTAGNGYVPTGDLVEAPNGKLYGLTNQGGAEDMGTIFEYDPITSNYALKFSFNGNSNGGSPYGSLTLSSNGKLYGLTTVGGTTDLGTVFEYNYDDTVKVTVNFDGTNGQNPYYSTLLALCNAFTLTPQPDAKNICETKELVIHSGAVGTGYTFQWYKNDTLIPTATNIDFIINSCALTDAGKYYCLVSDGCSSVQSTTNSVTVNAINSPGCEVTGAAEIDAKLPDVVIFPNPAMDHVNVKCNRLYDYKIKAELKNLLSQQVLIEASSSDKNPTIEINISGLKAGIYLIVVTDSNNAVLSSEKLVKY
ncbi:MAG TPA: T9SS type A sorting domain-containing protein [Bacteroidia bacterium]|nr:T9SS type A sorting domain-containing protein [Bacteroidia bacterium]